MPAAIRSGLEFLGKFFELVATNVVVDQGAFIDVLGGAFVVVTVGEFIARADHVHPQVFEGGNDVAGTQAADHHHHFLAF